MPVPLLDLTRQAERVRAAVEARVSAVFASQQFVLGPTVEAFEQSICEFLGCAHAVGMSSGTDAELAILMAMDIGPGDAVVTTPYTFFSTAGCIHRVGAEPVFVDISADTFHMDPGKLREYLSNLAQTPDGLLLTARGNRVRAVLPVHLFGACCAMESLEKVVTPYHLPIIEDAAQAIGAQYPMGGRILRAGTLGEAAFFSFFPTKNLGGAGDGGMAVCRSRELSKRLRRLRNHGMEARYRHKTVGGNFRLDALQAAVLQAKLPFLEEWNAARRRIAAQYHSALSGLPVRLPSAPWQDTGVNNHHTWHQYVVRAERRDELLCHLNKKQIGHAIYYPIPLHLQEAFSYLDYQLGDLPAAEHASSEAVALPIFPELREEEIAEIVEAIRGFYLR